MDGLPGPAPRGSVAKAARKETKRLARCTEEAARVRSRTSMHRGAQTAALEAFAGLMVEGTLFPASLPVAVQLRIRSGT